MNNIPAWTSSINSNFDTLADDIHCDFCVVGLGGTGLSAIERLLQLGYDVVGIDKSTVASGAAGRNGGLLTVGPAKFYHQAAKVSPIRARKLYQATLDEVKRFKRRGSTVESTGMFRVAHTQQELYDCVDHLNALHEDGFNAQLWTDGQLKGLFLPNDCRFNPKQHWTELANNLALDGATLYEHTEAVKIEPYRVHTNTGTIRAQGILVCVDGNLDKIFPQLSDRYYTVRLQMLGTAPLSRRYIDIPVYRRYGYEWYHQLPDNRIVLGGCRDIGGEEEYTNSGEPSEKIQQLLTSYLNLQLNTYADVTHRWAASVGYTKDGFPIYECIRESIYAVGGFNGTGNLVGSVYGRAAAEMMSLGRSAHSDILQLKC